MKVWFELWFNGFHGDNPLCYGVAYFLCTCGDTVEDDDGCSQSHTINISIKWAHCNYRTLCICFNFKLDEPTPVSHRKCSLIVRIIQVKWNVVE